MIRENFTQVSNGMVCDCGKHHGVGEWSPQKRAAVYARQRDQLPDYYFPHQKAYVESWESEHGKIEYILEWTELKVKAKEPKKYQQAVFIDSNGYSHY